MEANAKQYGKYDGNLLKDPTCVTKCTEQELYFLINYCGGFIWRMNHDMADGRITEHIDLTSYQYAMEYGVMHTTRFGVEIPEPKSGEHVKATDSYWAWFRWWDNYFQHTISQEEYENYQKKLSAGEDISKFRPDGNWRDNI